MIQKILLNERKQLQEISDQLKSHEATINEQKATIAALKTSVATIVPIGFIYVQLPKDKAPADIWPSFKWLDASADYQGVFFRVMGGTSGKFGEIQVEDAPRITTIQLSDASKYADKNVNIPKGGLAKIKAGSTGNLMYFEFDVSNTEVRPRNMAVKVWRRTA